MSSVPPASKPRVQFSSSHRSIAERRLVLDGVSWLTYGRLVTELERGGSRLAYDQGRLEIMSPSFLHEIRKRQLAYISPSLNGNGRESFAPGSEVCNE
jgi:hypothetical protein